ncbi:MAG: succinylglutamate desuccinylase/aspartoacylase family protein [Gammaproteobacteria bacterium]|nr:succinylglutamate desuccinylase/aspartoacylase family protein [Gammaproteobacteria bacterium]NNM19934.1 succinylglutamate desuccinylase/aspartoacylase family protein [Gammaproteobacteria bacterium]
MPVHVVNGKHDGPVLFLSAAIHGDELNGIEIVRRVVNSRITGRLRGTLIAVPIVNVLGVVHQSRYLPDRRDLNRSFPGSPTGSLAARMAHLFMNEVVERSTHGIDLHTGALHRDNLPQVRGKLGNRKVKKMAEAFGAPVVLDSAIRDGSLRDAATERGIPVLLYEAGEALRFNEAAIRIGVSGVFNVMRDLGMLPPRKRKPSKPFVARSSTWIRAPVSGVFRATTALGAEVTKGQRLGVLSDPFGAEEVPVQATAKGIIIGRSNLPLVHEGEAIYHIGRVSRPAAAAAHVEQVQDLTSQDVAGQSPPIV